MPVDIPDPASLMAVWASGLTLAVSVVIGWRIVGPGFVWTAGGVGVLITVFSLSSGPIIDLAAIIGLVAIVCGIALARRAGPASVAFLVSAMALAVAGSAETRWPLVISGLLALGGTTAEMLLGHWYLIDPTLPRWSLRALTSMGLVGLGFDALLVVVVFGALASAGTLGWIFLALIVVSALMMIGVWFALRETGYEGVMSATGLSYLSVLTALGAIAVGRYLVA